ncbi:dtdp-4-dehydrorhamnose -epimerase [Lasius niger]|uniref:Dtdp-4-dehydrorhamnose-epimerase n=1 Tax=Lasius niger TaxID=67767 RepID=A0A0J7NA76_LASNI|nr:dtdp-4-dehydrorhamnose -epimerase [Lasius niger]
MAKAGLKVDFVQDNQSISHPVNTIRGLHCQKTPFAQGKLVRCGQGSILDVAIDARTGSPHYGKWVSHVLTAEKGEQLWVPPGFLHGFQTLEENCLVLYKCTAPYDHASDAGVLWNDSEIGLKWHDLSEAPVLSEKDQKAGSFREIDNWFPYADFPDLDLQFTVEK